MSALAGSALGGAFGALAALWHDKRAVGLPAPAPDILGLTVSFTGSAGHRHDVLLATTGLTQGLRFVLVPRTDPSTCAYSSLLPYQTPRGLVLLAATPAPETAGAGGSLAFRLLAAGLVGPWREFGVLELAERGRIGSDEPIRFDPVLYVLPGLRWPAPLTYLREPAYAAARRNADATVEPPAVDEVAAVRRGRLATKGGGDRHER